MKDNEFMMFFYRPVFSRANGLHRSAVIYRSVKHAKNSCGAAHHSYIGYETITQDNVVVDFTKDPNVDDFYGRLP